LAEEVRSIATEGLMVLEEVAAVGGGRLVGDAVRYAEGAVEDVVRATIWGQRTGPRSPHLRAVDALYRHGAEWATVLLGLDGVLEGERRRARLLAANRGVPALTVAVGERGAIVAALAEVGGLAGLVTLEGGERNRPYTTEKLHGARVRVMLLTSEAAHGAEGPLYFEFVRALRHGGAAGATVLRGVWGFRGDAAPHGDRVLALRRDVPLIVETVDTAERAAEWLGIAESLAGESDGVCSRHVPTILSFDGV